jgi:hypothetical protein
MDTYLLGLHHIAAESGAAHTKVFTTIAALDKLFEFYLSCVWVNGGRVQGESILCKFATHQPAILLVGVCRGTHN